MVDAALVKALRDRTGLGFMQCKEALVEAAGDMEKAVDLLRQKGLKSADRKADRATSQGRIAAVVEGGRAALVELDCESDFVARNQDFAALGDEICRLVLAAPSVPASVEALLEARLGTGTVAYCLKAAIAKIGENIRLKRFVRLDAPDGGGVAACYVHPPGRIAVLMQGTGSRDVAAASTVLRDLCMHVAAANPVSLAPEDIPSEVLEREKAVYAVLVHEEARKKGKPAAVAEKMLQGKLQGFYNERCLLRQSFVKNPSVTVSAHVLASAPGLSVRRFVRYEIGA